MAGNVSGSGLADADAAVTDMSDITLSIATADCAPVALASEEGVIGAVHGGWKGLAEGVLENTARAMRELGATRIDAALGPCIHSECYEFGELQLQDLADKWGKSIVGSTYSGKPSLNLPIAVMQACVGADVNLVHQVDTCTACDTSYYSYRARQDNARQVMLVWRDA